MKTATRFLLLLLTSCLISLTALHFAHATDYETEPNNDMEHADVLTTGVEMVGQTGSDEDVDWFAFDATRSGVLFVRVVVVDSGEHTVTVRDQNGTVLSQTITYSRDYSYGVGVTQPGTYYVIVEVYGSRHDSRPYSLEVSNPPPDTDTAHFTGVYEVISWTTAYDSGLIIQSSQLSQKYGRLVITDDLIILAITYRDVDSTKLIFSDVGAYSKEPDSLDFDGKYFGSQSIPYEFDGSQLTVTFRAHDDDDNYFTTTAHFEKLYNIYSQDQLDGAVSDLDGDGVLDMKDIIWGLQVMCGER